MLQLDALRVHAEARRQVALEPDRDVAQADRPVALVEQRLGHDPHGVREVEDPRAGCRPSRRRLRELQDHRHGPQRLGEPAGAGGLLADRPERRRQRLVDQPGGLAADPQLDDHEVGAVERLVA